MKKSRRKSTGRRAPRPGGKRTDRSARRQPARAGTWPDLVREDPHPTPYRPELVARLEKAVREGRYQPDPRALAAALIDRMDGLLG
jgi:anti-sigma28 factor (negative regulator of flagellin synthesis)